MRHTRVHNRKKILRFTPRQSGSKKLCSYPPGYTASLKLPVILLHYRKFRAGKTLSETYKIKAIKYRELGER